MDRFGGKVLIERRESGSPVGLLSTGISKNCAPRKKAAPRGSCIVRDLYFSNTTFFFLFLSLSFPLSPRRHTIRFPRDFLVKTENSSDSSWEGKSTRRENLSLDSSRFFTAFSFPTREILRQGWLVVFAPAWNK